MPSRVSVAAKFNGAVSRLIREERGLSQATVATKAHVSRAHLSRIESGSKQPSREVARAIASVLRLPLDALLLDPNEEEA
jgi:transcriptional regulator with XRE-family HTH domain